MKNVVIKNQEVLKDVVIAKPGEVDLLEYYLPTDLEQLRELDYLNMHPEIKKHFERPDIATITEHIIFEMLDVIFYNRGEVNNSVVRRRDFTYAYLREGDITVIKTPGYQVVALETPVYMIDKLLSEEEETSLNALFHPLAKKLIGHFFTQPHLNDFADCVINIYKILNMDLSKVEDKPYLINEHMVGFLIAKKENKSMSKMYFNPVKKTIEVRKNSITGNITYDAVYKLPEEHSYTDDRGLLNPDVIQLIRYHTGGFRPICNLWDASLLRDGGVAPASRKVERIKTY